MICCPLPSRYNGSVPALLLFLPPALAPPPPVVEVEVGVLVGDDQAELDPTAEVLFRSRSLDEVRLGGVLMQFFVGVRFSGLVLISLLDTCTHGFASASGAAGAGEEDPDTFGAIVETLADTVRPRRDEPRVGGTLFAMDDVLVLLVEDAERRGCESRGCW